MGNEPKHNGQIQLINLPDVNLYLSFFKVLIFEENTLIILGDCKLDGTDPECRKYI